MKERISGYGTFSGTFNFRLLLVGYPGIDSSDSCCCFCGNQEKEHKAGTEIAGGRKVDRKLNSKSK